MKAYKIVDGDGYTYQVTKDKPSEAELERISEQYEEQWPFEPFTIEEVTAKWATTHIGRRYLKVIDEADPPGAATDTLIGSPYTDVLHTQQGRKSKL